MAPRLVSLLAAVYCAYVAAGAARADPLRDIGLELQAGYVDLQTAQSDEIDKTGSALAASFIYRSEVDPGLLHFGIGVQTSKVDGENPQRGFKRQTFNVKAPFGDLRFTLPLFGLALGPSLRATFGQGADYDVEATPYSRLQTFVGALAERTWHDEDRVYGANFTVHVDATQGTREVRMLLIGVFATTRTNTPEKKAPYVPLEDAKPAPSAATAAPADAPAPAAVAAATPSEHVVFKFARRSAEIDEAARDRFIILAQQLADLGAKLGPIQVTGHTDSRGDGALNQRLSLQRAEAACKLFHRVGILAAQLTCTGVADAAPLASVASQSPDQRRVSLRFAPADAETAAKLAAIIASWPAPP